jgi:chlorite dismutase
MLQRVAGMEISVYDMRLEVASMYLSEISNSMATDNLGKVIHKFDKDERKTLADFTTEAERRVQENKQSAEIAQQTTKQTKDELDGFRIWLSEQLEQLNPRIDALNQDIMATRKNSAVSRDLGETNRRKLNLIQKRAAPTPRPSPGIKWPWQH